MKVIGPLVLATVQRGPTVPELRIELVAGVAADVPTGFIDRDEAAELRDELTRFLDGGQV